MLYIYLPVLYYHGNIYVTEEAYVGRRGFPLSQRSFLFPFNIPSVNQTEARPEVTGYEAH